MNEPRSRQFALVAQLAGELDELLQRAEKLPAMLERANHQLKENALATNAALQQYRAETSTIHVQIMKSIADFAVRHTNDVAARTTEEQKKLLEQCAHDAFERELAPHLRKLTETLSAAAKTSSRSVWAPWTDRVATAVAAMGFLAVILYFVRG